MTVHQPTAQFCGDIRPVAAPLRLNRGERAFELHPAIHLMAIGAYFAFASILCLAFMGKDLVVPSAIFAVGIAALFVTPGLWARVVPEDGVRKQSWAEFLAEGVECITGHLTARQAMAQILLLPGLMVGLAFSFAIIKASL